MSQTSIHSNPPNLSSRRRNADDSHNRKQAPTLGPGDRIAEGDTELLLDILPPDLANVAFENLRNEVQWNVMHHRGTSNTSFLFPAVILNFISVGGEVPRLVAVEGEVEPDGRYALMFFYKSTISVPPNMNCSIFTRWTNLTIIGEPPTFPLRLQYDRLSPERK